MKDKEKLADMNNYLDRLSLRIGQIEKESQNIIKEQEKRNTQLKRMVASIHVEMRNLKDRFEKVKKNIGQDKQEMRFLITHFKDVVKKESFAKLSDMVEEWGPENFTTRNDVLREISQLK